MGSISQSLLTSSIGIHAGFWLYLVIGSVVFYFIEDPLHTISSSKQFTVNDTFCQLLSARVNEAISSTIIFHLDGPAHRFQGLEEILVNECTTLAGMKNKDENTSAVVENDASWEFSGALFLSMTVVTTIGYGSFAPLSDAGKVFCIFFGFFGIPFCGVLLANTSSYFSSILLTLYDSRRKGEEKWHGILLAASVFLLPGLGLFLFIPAVLFSYIEGWTYLDALYFSFVTLTTIGFGDIVATWHADRHWLWFYRISWIVWVFLGIAYWAIIISFITKAFKSKKLRNRWKQTVRLIGHEAHVMSKQLTPGAHRDSFVAASAKTAFDFALQLTGSVGRLEPEIHSHFGHALPGIATALKPTPGKGLMALMQLSAGLIAKRSDSLDGAQVKTTDNRSTAQPADAHRDSVNNIYTISSIDSGIDVSGDVSIDPKEQSGELLKQPRPRANSITKTDSTCSLPIELESQVEAKKPDNKRKLFLKTRSQTRPELKRMATMDKQSMQDLILQAVMILHQAHTDGSTLDVTAEQ